MVDTADGHGYWIVGQDGSLSHGDAGFLGSLAGVELEAPIVGTGVSSKEPGRCPAEVFHTGGTCAKRKPDPLPGGQNE